MSVKKVVFILSLLFCFFFSQSSVFADDLYQQLPVETQQVFAELDKVTEIDEEGLITINLDKAIEVAIQINTIYESIKTDGISDTVRRMERALFPIGAYGNYCGMGNKGWNVPPIDDLDSACFLHDLCFKGFHADNTECNREFCRRLLPVIQKAQPGTYKSIYAKAAFKLFSS